MRPSKAWGHIGKLPARRRTALYLTGAWIVAVLAVVIPLAIVGGVSSWPTYALMWIGASNAIGGSVILLEVARCRIKRLSNISEEAHSVWLQALFGLLLVLQVTIFAWDSL